MSGWLIALIIVGYLAVGIASGRIAEWLHREGFIIIGNDDDVRITMMSLVVMWPIIVPGWAVIRVLSFLLFPRRMR